MTENIITGKKMRVLMNKASDLWGRISLWTKASDVEFNDGSTVEDNKPIAILKRNKQYNVGDVAYASEAPGWAMFVCTVAGITASTSPGYQNPIVGNTYNDGTAQFKIYDLRAKKFSDGVSSNAENYTPIAYSDLKSIDEQLYVEDGSNIVRFKFGYHNNIYGYYTTNNDFIPFGGKIVETELWTNPDPTVSFAAQEITLVNSDYDVITNTYELQKYDYIKIIYRDDVDDAGLSDRSVICSRSSMEEGDYSSLIGVGTFLSDWDNNALYVRYCYMPQKIKSGSTIPGRPVPRYAYYVSVYFEDAMRVNASGKKNTLAIPIKVIGVQLIGVNSEYESN